MSPSRSAAPPAGTATLDTATLDTAFDALADPTRRDLLERLAREGPASATVLAAGRPVSRQAVTKHLQVLAGADLVTSERVGREVRFRARGEGLVEVAAWVSTWLAETGASWDDRLGRLQRQLAGSAGSEHGPGGRNALPRNE